MVEVLLLKAGVQIPVIPSLETKGSGDEVAPAHIGNTWVKVGVILLFKEILPLKEVPPQPLTVAMV